MTALITLLHGPHYLDVQMISGHRHSPLGPPLQCDLHHKVINTIKF